jgi:hypothetical protein
MFQIMDKDDHVNIGINTECSFEMEMFGCDRMAVIYCMTIKATAYDADSLYHLHLCKTS